LQPEVLLLLDRSSSMLDSGAWSWVTDSLSSELTRWEIGSRIGLRQFPSTSGCSVGSVLDMEPAHRASIVASFQEPSTSASTPIAAALTDLVGAFGDPNDAQAVVLITDGDESCATRQDAVNAAQGLWERGVLVYVLPVTTTANQTFLNDLARVGGTGTGRSANDSGAFVAHLRAVFQELAACDYDICNPRNPAPVCGSGYHCLPQESETEPPECSPAVGPRGAYEYCASEQDCQAPYGCVFNFCTHWCTSGEDCTGVDEVCSGADLFIGSQEWGTCLPTSAPSGWVCNPNWWDSNDGCDCGCGAFDPDCPTNLATEACLCFDGCGNTAPSVPDCTGIDPSNNAVCL
jgi:hypothetical protein